MIFGWAQIRTDLAALRAKPAIMPANPSKRPVARSCGLRSRSGAVVGRRDLDPLDVTSAGGVDLTAKPLTALETAAALLEGSVFLDRALQKHVRFPALYGGYCRNLGAQGNARAPSCSPRRRTVLTPPPSEC